MVPPDCELRVQLLGMMHVSLLGPSPRVLFLPQGPQASLFAYLALSPATPIARSRLAGLLNPDASETSARRSLSDALYRLRRELGDAADAICANGESVSLAGANLRVDVLEFQRAASSMDYRDWERALKLYSGDLLEDLDAEWLLAPRATLREQFLATLERLCTVLMDRQRWPEALTWAHRWSLADPLCEQAHRLTMQLYARLGRHAAALEQYDRLVHALAEEMGVEPLPETRQLADTIRCEHETNQTPSRPPFVGRRTERGQLLQAADRALAGEGAILLVEGEPGIGKTRLLEEFASGAEWRGFNVAWGRAQPLAAIPPYAPLSQALSQALVGPRADLVRSQISPENAQSVSFLVPRLGSVAPAKSLSIPDVSASASCVIATLAELTPQVLIFDDVQWADSGFWDVMRGLASSITSKKLLLVLSYRSQELRENADAWTRLRELDSCLALPKIILGGLSLAESTALAREVGFALDDDTAFLLHTRTGGNPLFYSEALMQPDQTSISFFKLLETRWSELDMTAQMALQAGAVLGRDFTHGTWQATAEIDILDAVPHLISKRFITETEHGYTFRHDLTRDHIYRTVSSDQKLKLHRLAGQALAREKSEPSVLAWHFEQGQAWQEAIHYHREAGERAEKSYACRVAAEHYAHALALLPHLGDGQAQRLALLSRRQRALFMVIPGAEWRATVAELEQAAALAGDLAATLEAVEARINMCVLDCNWEGMQAAGKQAIALATDLDDIPALTRIENTLGWHFGSALGRWEEAQTHIQHAIDLAKASGDTFLLADASANLAFTLRMKGETSAARETIEHAIQLTESAESLRVPRAGALHTLAQIEWDAGHWEAARAASRQAVTLREELADAWSLGETLFDYALITMGMGQFVEARETATRLVFDPSSADNAVMINNSMWVRALLAEVELLAGQFDAAEQALRPTEKWMQSTKSGRAVQHALRVLGQLRLAQNRPQEALLPLARAAELWRLQPTIELAPLLFLSLAAQRTGESDLAMNSLTQVQAIGKPIPRYAPLYYLIRYEVLGCVDDLSASRAEVNRQAGLFSNDQLRSDFISQVALHRQIEECWQALCPKQVVRLARTDATPGRPLSDGDYVYVQWTVDGGEPDALILSRQGKVALRQHRLRRLIGQAQAQKARPTAADLARALGVDRRTILRDMQVIRPKLSL